MPRRNSPRRVRLSGFFLDHFSEQSVLARTPERELPDVKASPEGYELGYMIPQQLIRCREDVTAMVAVNERMAVGIMDAGEHTPDDYSVCGCDNTGVCKYRGISLTSVESYSRQASREAVDVLVRKIVLGGHTLDVEDNPDGVTRIEYFPKLIVRRSTEPWRNG